MSDSRFLVVRPECRLSHPMMPFVQTEITGLITLMSDHLDSDG
jgi:hypothetical protein